MLPRVVDEHTRINLTGQTINCRNSLQLFVMMPLGCTAQRYDTGQSAGNAKKNYCIRPQFPNFRLIW